MLRRSFVPALACMTCASAGDITSLSSRIVETRLIWDQAPHNAFTDLVRFKNRFYCAFREGSSHVSPDGAIRILSSADGRRWDPAGRLQSPVADLRDPKLTVSADNRLMLTAAGAMHPPSDRIHQTYAWYSFAGREWTDAVEIGEPDMWLWRVTWQRGTAYGVGYHTTGPRFASLYASRDGFAFQPLVRNFFDKEYPNESALLFLPDDTGLCLLRRDGKIENTAQLGVSRPPYRGWKWTDLGVRVGGPQMICLPDERIVAAVRLYDGKVRTSLCWLDPREGGLTEFQPLVSGGDTSYAGMVFHEEVLWVSYYSSHEGKTSIYLAKVRLPEGKSR